ncbi:MAG TPA: SDR family oxidoreductase [Conexibacter sp.]|nr:SDR family oxidoreductase [Conexibacter sp.]
MGRVLLTGASGAIGAEVAALLAGGGDRVLALLHRERRIVRNDRRPLAIGPSARVEPLAGDIAQPRLGLAQAEWERLRSSVDVIVHSAAVTEFGRPEAIYRAVNVEGTRNVLDLATAGPRPIPLVHVSTAYVCGDRHGIVREDELSVGQSFANGYERSKHDAELLVRAAMERGLPAVIARPSIVVGSSRSGVTRELKNFYMFVKLLVEGRLSVVPASYDALLDFVPVDYVAEAIADVARHVDQADGSTLHLVGAVPLTLREIGDVLAEYPSFVIPRFVPPPSFDETRLSSLERRYHQRVAHLFTPYLTRHVVFSAEQARRVTGVRQAASGKPLLRRLIDYALRVGYIGAPARPIDEVLASLAAQPAS